jgi:hypothetical protein
MRNNECTKAQWDTMHFALWLPGSQQTSGHPNAQVCLQAQPDSNVFACGSLDGTCLLCAQACCELGLRALRTHQLTPLEAFLLLVVQLRDSLAGKPLLES